MRSNSIIITAVLGLLVVAVVSCQKRLHKYAEDASVDSDVVTFPDDDEDLPIRRTPAAKTSVKKQELPLELAKKINDVQSMDEFVDKFVKSERILAARFGFGGSQKSEKLVDASERSGAMVPRPAGCKAEPQVVKLELDELFYYPTCTRVNRCSGCCSHSLLSCQPVDKETLTFQVMVLSYNTEGIQKKSKELVFVEQHTKCKCDCTIKAEDCNELQVYEYKSCQCKCRNEDERAKCEAQKGKLWDANSCSCKCKDELTCTTSQYFNTNTCTCILLPATRRRTPYDQFRRNYYNAQPLVPVVD